MAAVLAGMLLVPPAAHAAGQTPRFQMPFHCGQVWWASTYDGHWPNTNAIDLGMFDASGSDISNGQDVLASAAGTVSEVGTNGDGTTGTGTDRPDMGNYVYIDHGNGWQTIYAHFLEAPSVVVGQLVAAGQKIGRVGATGWANNTPHLHYVQLQDGNAVRVQFNGANINTYSGNVVNWPGTERLTGANCGGLNIIAQHSGKCLTTPGNNTVGAQITQATCSGDWTQLWTRLYLGMGHYQIQSMSNGMCLDVGGPLAHATPVVQNWCGPLAGQSWLIGRQPNNQNTWWDYRVTSSLCLDVGWASQDDGAGLYIANCWAGSNQIFRTVSVTGPGS
jgi:hypothetical protein